LLSSTKDRKPLLTFKLYKRHIIAIIILIAAAIFGYSIYFKYFMILPPSAIHVLPDLPVDLTSQKVLLFAPHCDDEILSSGGLIHRALSQGSSMRVIITTDCNKHKNGDVRKKETETGLATVGLSKQNIGYFNLPEGEGNYKNSADDSQVREAIKGEVESFNPTIVVLPLPQDSHRDHAIVGRVGQSYLEDKKNIQVIYYLIHYNFLRFPSPPGLQPDAYVLPPARLINFSDRWYKFDLTDDEIEIKEDAISKYKSQLSLKNPILVRVLWDFARKNELFMMETK